MNDLNKTNVLVGAFAVGVLALFAYAAVRLGPTGLAREHYKEIIVYVPSATGLYEDSAVRVAGVQVGLIKEISLERGLAKVTVNIRSEVELHKNARATVKSSGLLGDRYIEIDPGTPDPQALLERAGPPEQGGVRIIYADEAGDIEQLTQQLGRAGQNLEAITDNLRAVLEKRPGGNEDLAKTLESLAKLTSNLAEMSGENREDIRELVKHLRSISETVDRETPGVASDVRELVRELKDLIESSRSDVKETLASFRASAERFDNTLKNVEEISRKVNDGEGTIGRLINDDETVDKINNALDGINQFVDFAKRLEVKVGYRAEVQPRVEDAKSVIALELWPRPDKYYFVNITRDPAGTRPKTTTITTTNTVVGNPFFPPANTQTITSTQSDELEFSIGIGKRFEYFTVFGGLIENSGGIGASFSPDRYKHFDIELTLYDFGKPDSDRPNFKARASLYFWKYFYLSGGVEDILAANTDDIQPFFGGGIYFVDDDLKPLLGAAASSGASAVP